MKGDQAELLREAKRRVEESKNLGVLTGAGISAESGIPVFRGKDGLWKEYRAEELATPEAFQRNPELVWEWYRWRRGIIREKKPNPAHYALAAIESKLVDRGGSFTLITQNVDGLHDVAGSRNVVKIHGDIWDVKCTNPGCGFKKRERSALPPLPRCEACGSLLRPGVVWFGEALPSEALERVDAVLATCDTFIVVGTSGVVQPAASFALLARRNGAFVIEVNLEHTPISYSADITLLGKAGTIMPKLADL